MSRLEYPVNKEETQFKTERAATYIHVTLNEENVTASF